MNVETLQKISITINKTSVKKLMNQIKLSSLPNEAKLTVVQYLSVKDYLNLSETSRYWFNFIEKNVKYLPKWEVDEFSVRCSGNSEEGLECEAICRGGKPTRIKKIQSKNGDELCTTFQRINVSHSLYFELKSPLNCTEILKENAKRVQQLALQISNTSNFTLGYFIDLISSLPRCEVLSLEMDGMDERNEGKLILQAIPILRHMEIRSLNSPFYFDDSALETLTERSSAENAIDCLVLSTAATSFSIESVRHFLENTVFLNYAFIQFSKIDGTFEAFVEMLLQIATFDSEPTRGIFCSFVVIINYTLICLNIGKFDTAPLHMS